MHQSRGILRSAGMLGFFVFVLLFVATKANTALRHSTLTFSTNTLLASIKEAKFMCKSQHHFVTSPPTTGTDEFQVQVAEKLCELQKKAGSTAIPTSVTMDLPKDTSVKDYLIYILTKIESHPDISKFNDDFAIVLQKHLGFFILERSPELSKRPVCMNVVELDKMLQSNFKYLGGKVVQHASPVLAKTRLQETMLFTMLFNLSKIRAHVYIPDNLFVSDFVMLAIPNTMSMYDNCTDKVWSNVLSSLKRREDLHVQKVSLSFLIETMNSVTYSNPHAHSYSSFPASSTAKVNVPGGFSADIGLNNCDKIYVNFDVLPFNSGIFSDRDIVYDFIIKSLTELNSAGISISSSSDLVARLQVDDNVFVNYHFSFIDRSTLLSISTPLREFNDIIAQLMNSKKFPFTITESAIVPPPSDSPFKVEVMYGDTNYSHLQFPHDINMKIDKYTLLGKYVKFVFKKINADQNSNQVCKEFFLHFWASATVSEFEAQFSVVFSDDFKRIKELDDIKAFWEEEDAREWAMAHKDKLEEEKKVNEKFTYQSKHDSNSNSSFTASASLSTTAKIILAVVIFGFGGVIVVVILYYLRRKKKKKTRRQTDTAIPWTGNS